MSRKLPRITSKFGLLDVTHGRHKLYSMFRGKYGGLSPDPLPPIKVVIEAEIVGVWGNDDGASREFELKIIKVKDA